MSYHVELTEAGGVFLGLGCISNISGETDYSHEKMDTVLLKLSCKH